MIMGSYMEKKTKRKKKMKLFNGFQLKLTSIIFDDGKIFKRYSSINALTTGNSFSYFS